MEHKPQKVETNHAVIHLGGDQHFGDESDVAHQEHAAHIGHEDHTGHVDHTGHEQMFRNRFWICLSLSIPVLLYSPMLQGW